VEKKSETRGFVRAFSLFLPPPMRLLFSISPPPIALTFWKPRQLQLCFSPSSYSHPLTVIDSTTMANKTGATSLGMQSENFGYSRVRLRRIKKLQFGVVNPNELVGCW
jgi:hypothetical protein